MDASTAAGLLIVRTLPGTPIGADATGHVLQLGEILDPVDTATAAGLLIVRTLPGTPIGADAAGHVLQAPVCHGSRSSSAGTYRRPRGC